MLRRAKAPEDGDLEMPEDAFKNPLALQPTTSGGHELSVRQPDRPAARSLAQHL